MTRVTLQAFKDPARLAAIVHRLQKQVQELEADSWLYADIISTQLNVAICDFCQREWFTVHPVSGPGPRGDVRGLLVAGGACCRKCLDQLYESSVDLDQDEWDQCAADVARWALRHQGVLAGSVWSEMQDIRQLMKQFSL